MQNWFDYTSQPGRTLERNEMAGTQQPLVSVITPYFNVGEVFEQTYRCVMNQTFPWFEWIIVDDGSTNEDSIRRLHHLAETDTRIRVYTKENEGAAAARNYAVKQAQTEYLAMYDADDLIEPTFLETLYLALLHTPQAAWAYTDIVTFGAEEFLWKREFSSQIMREDNVVPITSMVRKSAFDAVGGFDVEKFPFHEDWHFWLKLLSRKMRPVHVKDYLFWYRNEKKGMLMAVSATAESQKRNDEKIAEIAKEVPDGILAFEPEKEGKKFELEEFWQDIRLRPWADKKANILFVFPHMVMGGADKFNLQVIQHFSKEYHISIVTTLREENEWKQKFSSWTSDIFSLPAFLPNEKWAAFLDYIIVSRQIDVVFISNSYYMYYAVPLLRHKHPAVTFVDYIHAEDWSHRNGGFPRPSSAVQMFLDKTYVCNEHLRQVMLEQFGRSPADVKTIYIGVDHKWFDPEKVECEDAKRELPEHLREQPVVLFPCRVCEHKRPILAAEIARRLPQYTFVVVGDGVQEEALRGYIRHHKIENMLLVGRKEDMRPWYKLAKITLICSLMEGLALTVFESLAMGTPVVSADVGGHREAIDSQVGRIVPLYQDPARDLFHTQYREEEIQAYVEAIESLCSASDYEQICRCCRERCVKKFTQENMKQVLEEELYGLASETRKKERKNHYVIHHEEKMSALFKSYLYTYDALEQMAQAYVNGDYFRQLWEQRGLPAENELNRIRKMRSYRVAEIYQRLMNKLRK